MKSSSNTKARTTGLNSKLDFARTMTGFNKARNKLLFNFGMLLLEVRYGKLSGELKRSILKASVVDGGNANFSDGTIAGTVKGLSDYWAAESLAQMLVSQWG